MRYLSSRRHRKSPPRRYGIRRVLPHLEQLEDRLALSAVWMPQGPGPILYGQPAGMEQQGNPDVGAVNSLVPDPSNVNILYAATASGGIWKTTDATDSNPIWTPLIDNQPNLSIGDIALSPLDANTLYAGTGHFSNGTIGTYGLQNGGLLNGPVGDGVLKSTDSGATWSPLIGQATFAGQNIRDILPTAVTSSTGQVVLAGSSVNAYDPPPAVQPQTGGVYLSSDGGQNWTRVSGAATSGLPDGDVRSLVEDPTNPNIIYAGVIGVGVYQSLDAGQTWQPINGNISNLLAQAKSPYGLSGTNNLQLAISASKGTTTLFLLTAGPKTTGDRAPGASYLLYSTDGGTSWSAMAPVPMINQDDQENNNLALTTDPSDPTVVWVTGSEEDVGGGGLSIVYRGDSSQPNGSQQWQLAVWTGAEGNPPGGSGNKPTVAHSDGRYLGFDAAGNLLLTNDGGIYKLVNPNAPSNSDGTNTGRYWVSLNGNLQDTELYAVAYDSIDHIIVGGSQDNGMGVQPAPGQSIWNTGFPDDVTHVAVDNSGSKAVLYGMNSTFISTDSKGIHSEFKRGDFSTTANAVNTDVNLAAPNSSTIGSGLNKADYSLVGGVAYIPFVLDSADPQWLLIGFNGLYISTDQGDHITEVTPSSVSGQFTALAFGGMAGSTANANVAVAGTTGGQLFVSVNANSGGNPGATFNLATTFSGSGVRSIAFDPSDWHTVYIVTTSSGGAGHIWQMVLSNNGQVASLTEITGDLALQASQLQTVAAVNPAPGVTTLVVGGLGSGSGSVFRTVGSINGSATQWQLLGSGLPNVNVHDLVYNPADDVLVAATFGRGAWTLASASQALLPASPPSPTSPPSPPLSPATFPASIQQQLQLNVALLPTFSNSQGQALLTELFGVAFALAQQQTPTQAQELVQQEVTLFLDLAFGNMAAAIADANALADNSLYNTSIGYILGLIEGEWILSTIISNS
jgi:hypothetical protein